VVVPAFDVVNGVVTIRAGANSDCLCVSSFVEFRRCFCGVTVGALGRRSTFSAPLFDQEEVTALAGYKNR